MGPGEGLDFSRRMRDESQMADNSERSSYTRARRPLRTPYGGLNLIAYMIVP
jgi:hypothetical protein